MLNSFHILCSVKKVLITWICCQRQYNRHLGWACLSLTPSFTRAPVSKKTRVNDGGQDVRMVGWLFYAVPVTKTLSGAGCRKTATAIAIDTMMAQHSSAGSASSSELFDKVRVVHVAGHGAHPAETSGTQSNRQYDNCSHTSPLKGDRCDCCDTLE